MSVTYAVMVDGKAAGYFSLLNDRIVSADCPKNLINRLRRLIPNNKRHFTYPAVKVGRLAVAVEYQGMGLGRSIIDFLKGWFTIGNKTGCRFITVDSYSDSADFYERCGFIHLQEKDQNSKTRLMYFDLYKFKDSPEH